MKDFFSYDGKLMQILNRFADLMFLNLLTMVCCIPIITIGPSITAMHYVLLKMYRNESGYMMRSYFKSFKENFIQSMILGLIYVGIAVVLFIDLVYIRRMENVSLLIEIVVIVAIVLSAFSYVWVFPLQCRYENKIRTTIKNSFMVGALNFPKSIMMILISFLPMLALMWTNASVPVLIMLGISVPAYIQTMLYSPVFDKLEGIERTTEGEIIDDGWTVELEEIPEAPVKEIEMDENSGANVQNDGEN